MAVWESPRFWYVALVASLALGVYGWKHAPYAQKLPLDVQHLDDLKPALAKLPTEAERQLVLGYLARSNGDVLPPSMADPDAPLIARTFGQAITLQRQFLAKEIVRQAQVLEKQAKRQVELVPLREAVDLKLTGRRIGTYEDFYGQPSAQGGGVKHAFSGGNAFLVTTYRLRNTAGQDLTSVRGEAVVYDSAGTERDRCWIDRRETLQAFSTADVACGQMNRPAGEASRDYVALPASELLLVWTPRYVEFADGKKLEVRP